MSNTPIPLSESPIAGTGKIPDDIARAQLQTELSLLKNDYKRLLVEYHQKKDLLSVQADSMETLRSSIAGLMQSVSTLNSKNDELLGHSARQEEELADKGNVLADKDNIIAEQNRKIHQLYAQIDTLNAILSDIYASEGWKLLTVYYRLRNSVLPPDSPRQKKVKKLVNWLRRKKSDDVAVIKDHSVPAIPSQPQPQPIAVASFEPFEFPYFARPKVSIVIPAYNGWEMNYLCLRSIWENTEGTSYEVIFADDVSTDETKDIEQVIKNITHIRNERNLGFLQNCNHAASFARGEYLHFLNNDTKVTHGWLSSLVGLMEKDPSIGMTGSKLVYPDGRLQEAGGIIWQDASGWNYGHKQDPDASEFNYVKEVDYISGASILVRKTLWDELGGFDEQYTPAYAEDSDLAFAIREKGYKVIYQPLSKVVHFEGFSHGTEVMPAGGSNIKSYQKVNNGKFQSKWKTVLEHQFPNGVNPYWTRDRSHGKPTIVVIDHYVPHFDKDAGSRTTFQYLELFTELGMNVKFIGDNFYRHEPYTTALQQMGIEVLYGVRYAENWQGWLLENEPYIDYILLNRPHISIKYVDFLRTHMHGKLFYYTHDLHYFRELMEYEVTRDPERLTSSERWKTTEHRIFSTVDVVLTPSNKEKGIIDRDFPDKPVEVMPAFFYPSVANAITNFNDRRDILFVGGFNHGPNVDAVLWFVNAVFPRIKEKNAAIRLILVGSNAPESIRNLASADIIVRGFVTDEELNRLYDTVRLAVIPLRFGAGLKGKTVEAMSKALPIVTTSFGIEGIEGVEPAISAHDTAAGFAEAVTALYDDIPKLESMSHTISAYARQKFTKESAAAFFKRLFFL